MREDIAEQLGVTPTPGGLEVLLRQSENNKMASGGIVNMANGGFALSVLSGMLNPGSSGGSQFNPSGMLTAGANALTGGGFGLVKYLAELANRNQSSNPLSDPFTDTVSSSTETRGLSPESIKNMETAGALSRISSGIYNAPGGKGGGKGAGGLQGIYQRKIRKENRKLNRLIDRFADTPFAQTVMNFVNRKKEQGFGSGAYNAFDRVAASPPVSYASSTGVPKNLLNFKEMKEYYKKHGTFMREGAPVPQYGDD
tara:strand:- start:160 stop:924 length:765 start_codon:yes stop_codon:yes gene_type:complete